MAVNWMTFGGPSQCPTFATPGLHRLSFVGNAGRGETSRPLWTASRSWGDPVQVRFTPPPGAPDREVVDQQQRPG